MKFIITTGNPTRRKEPLLVGLTEGPKLSPWAAGWELSLKTAAQGLLKSKKFHGKLNETFLLPLGPRWVVIVGLGKQENLSLDVVRQASASGARRMLAAGIGAYCRGFIPVPGASLDEVAQASAEGTILGTYRYSEMKNLSEEDRPALKQVTFVAPGETEAAAAKKGVRRAEVVAGAVCWARDLVNRPSNKLTPVILSREAKAAARKSGFRCQVLDPAAQKRLGMNALLGVARGSREPSQFIILEYSGPGSRGKRPLVWLGKGITFDSGGISIKPSANMEDMKYDMSGAAAVLGAFRAVSGLKLPVHIVGLIPATENLPGGNAQKPGDVVRAITGKTIEVINTDAEGRLVLADALGFARRFKPEAMVDLATLTGACVVALGSHCMGLMANNAKLAGQVKEAAARSHERAWELPLWPEYSEAIKSEVADVKNMGDGKAGTIIGGAFLKEFVGVTPWVHLDIAGVAWSTAEKGYTRKGATGVGVRLLVEMASRWKGLSGRGAGS